MKEDITEPRKVVLILGNGFDLDLGLKTSYKDFWESNDCPRNYPAPLIYHLNQYKKDKRDEIKWYDLENEFRQYYDSIVDKENGQDLITDEEKSFLNKFSPIDFQFGLYNDRLELLSSLVDKGVLLYQEKPIHTLHKLYEDDVLESPIWRDKKAFNLIKDSLCEYIGNQQCPIEAKKTVAYHVLLTLDIYAKTGNFVDIFTFNYTPLQVLDYQPSYVSINYMHGNCKEGNIVLGTGDDQNISSNYLFLQKSFAPYFTPPALVSKLHDADEIIIFGHSLGENDRQYFKAFFAEQTDYHHQHSKDITIFTFDNRSEIEIKQSLQKMTNGNLSVLYSQNNIQIIKVGNIIEDQQKLFYFLVQHGKSQEGAMDLVGGLTHSK